MADLFIRLPKLPSGRPLFAWRASGEWHCSEERPEGRFGNGESAVALVPGTSVTAHRAEIVARKPAEARRTALFAIEDDLAQPVEALHVALGPAGEGPTRDVHVASLDDMQRWLGYLNALGVPEADLVCVHALLPGGNVVVDIGDELLFRSDATTFACDSDASDDLVRSIAPDSIDTVYGTALARRLDSAARVEPLDGPEAALAQLAEWYNSKTPSAHVSLRQGDFAVRRSMDLKGFERWRLAGSLACIAGVAWLGGAWLETQALETQAADLRSRTNMIVRNFAPEANGNATAAIQSMQQSQRSAATSMRPTSATAALYEAVAPVENTEVRSLRYDANTGRLTAMVVFDDYAQADEIGSRLEGMGLSVTLGAARQSGARVLGEFNIEAAT
ncbi:type II secretion system protein GspL [Henriciella sp. AS95]|uniref:type II secretion system protein GspL n=1 Tax=Henriciella sp. AS95 TaxID=3135782 RepID=UPI003181FAFA